MTGRAASRPALLERLFTAVAAEAMVLLKNDGRVLPFDPARIKTLAVIGPDAADIHLGDYSAVPMRGVAVLAGLKEFAATAGMEVRYAEGCKLTVTVPRSVGQLPCSHDCPPSRFRNYALADSTPLFPFGFGLSYTTFEYRNLRLEPAAIPRDGSTRVSVDVANTGAVKADEIVQLYLHQLVSLPVRPVQELKDFARIPLAPGETRTVTFTLTPEKLAALGLDLKPAVPPGDYEILVGRSSADTLKATLTVR